jgi:hypothetical protein
MARAVVRQPRDEFFPLPVRVQPERAQRHAQLGHLHPPGFLLFEVFLFFFLFFFL